MGGILDSLGVAGTALAVRIAIGAALLMLGRRLYWLFVGAVGFVVAIDLASVYLTGSEPWVRLAIGIVVGLIGALLAIFLQKLAVAIAGFAAAAYFSAALMEAFALEPSVELVIIIVAGIIGAILAGALFDWALILLSSMIGADLLVDTFALEGFPALAVLVILTLAGISIQANMLHRDRARD